MSRSRAATCLNGRGDDLIWQKPAAQFRYFEICDPFAGYGHSNVQVAMLKLAAQRGTTVHTAFELKKQMFSVTVDGQPVDRDVFLDWEVRDRLGVLIDRPVGALGAGLLILLAITAFYDVPEQKRRMRPLYPDIFLFHIGGPWGPFMNFDFWPDHKEIFLPSSAREVLRVVNNRGITHLALPDNPARPVVHGFKEPEAAIDRIKQCYFYAPGTGIVSGGDVSIGTREMSVLDNFDGVLNLDDVLAGLAKSKADAIPMRLRPPDGEESRETFATAKLRTAELNKRHPDHVLSVARVATARRTGMLTETLRRSTVKDVLERLAQQ